MLFDIWFEIVYLFLLIFVLLLLLAELLDDLLELGLVDPLVPLQVLDIPGLLLNQSLFIIDRLVGSF